MGASDGRHSPLDDASVGAAFEPATEVHGDAAVTVTLDMTVASNANPARGDSIVDVARDEMTGAISLKRALVDARMQSHLSV